MASLQNVALLPLLLALTAVCVQGFRIRRRSVGMVGYEDSYGLSNALQAVQRRRTKKEMEEAFEPKYLDQDVGYYYPQLSDEMEARGPSYRPTFHGTGSYESDEEFDIPKLYNLQKGAYPVSYGASDSFEFPYPRVGFGDRRSLSPQKRTLVSSYKPRRVPPTLTELEDIFSSANVPMKGSGISPVRRSDHNKGIKQASNNRHIAGDEQNDTGSKQHKEKKSLANFDVEQMRKLIEKAEELQREADENVSSESAEEQPTGPNESEIKGPVSVSESELDKIFSITDDKGNTKTVQIKQTDVNGEKHTEVKESESVPVTSDEEKTVEEDEGINAYKSKNKRMAKRDQSETVSDIAELVAKIDMLKGEVQRLRVKQIVEEKENDLLAEALKAATLDQINHSDEFLEQEFDAIDKATEAEELLQTLPDDTVETKYDEAEQLLGEYLSSDDSEDEDLMEEVKRDEEDDEDELEEEGADHAGWQEAAIEEQVSPGAELGSRLQEHAEDLDEEDLVIEPDMDPELAEEIEEEEMEDEDDTDGLNDKQQILSQLLQGMSPEELADLVNQYSESNSDTCPIITEISSNCVFADKLQMPIDDDARQLCNRHELCYSCGATLGLPMNGCDTGYTHDAIESCGDDVECIQDAEIFLKMMKSYHTYQPFRHAQCDRPCIEDYIIGNDMKKR